MIRVCLTGLAHKNFDKIHHHLENDRLTIISRGAYLTDGSTEEGDVGTCVHVVCGPNDNLDELVKVAIDQVNEIYSGCAQIKNG